MNYDDNEMIYDPVQVRNPARAMRLKLKLGREISERRQVGDAEEMINRGRSNDNIENEV